MKNNEKSRFHKRMSRHFDELETLYMGLYHNSSMFAELCNQLECFYDERKSSLKESDLKREADSGWYKQNDMLGMMLYIDNFAKNIKGANILMLII